MNALLLLFAYLGVALASKAMVAKDFKEGEVLELCTKSGEFLLHPTNRCKYIRCTFGDEPWQDDEGNYKFYPTVQDCPYGTAVSRSFYGHEGGYGYGSEGADLEENRLCTDRVYRQHNQHSVSHGHDQCDVEAPHGYAYPTQQHYGRQAYGKHGYAPVGYSPYVGYGYPGYATHGYVQPAQGHNVYAYPVYASYGVSPQRNAPKEIRYPTH